MHARNHDALAGEKPSAVESAFLRARARNAEARAEYLALALRESRGWVFFWQIAATLATAAAVWGWVL